MRHLKLTCGDTGKVDDLESLRDAKAGLVYPFPSPAAKGPELTASVAKTWKSPRECDYLSVPALSLGKH